MLEAKLVRLNETAKMPYIPDLIDRKTGGPEKQIVGSYAGQAFRRRRRFRSQAVATEDGP